jgi:hypothetical protein
MTDCEKPGATRPRGEEFGAFLHDAGTGYAGGLLIGFTLDSLEFQQSS